jgi:hypothetical protein
MNNEPKISPDDFYTAIGIFTMLHAIEKDCQGESPEHTKEVMNAFLQPLAEQYAKKKEAAVKAHEEWLSYQLFD